MTNIYYPLAVLALCASSLGFSQTRPMRPSRMESARAAARLLDQASWGPTPASIAQVQEMGIDAWLKAQFALNTSDLPDQPILNSAGTNNNNLAPVQSAFFSNAVTGQDQLRQRVAFVL